MYFIVPIVKCLASRVHIRAKVTQFGLRNIVKEGETWVDIDWNVSK